MGCKPSIRRTGSRNSKGKRLHSNPETRSNGRLDSRVAVFLDDMLLSYPKISASLMVFYRNNFKDTEDYPVAYTAIGITAVLAFLAIAVSVRLQQSGIFSVSMSSFPRWQHFVFWILVYLGQTLFLTSGGRWKRYLHDFEALPAKQQTTVNVATLLFVVLPLLWMCFELFFAAH